MTDHDAELAVFPTDAPPVFRDADTTRGLFADVLGRLAEVVDLTDAQGSLPTPCAGFDAAQLQAHVLGWLGFFAAALDDPDATTPRPDPPEFALSEGEHAADVVRRHAAAIDSAIEGGAAERLVVMSSSRMAGDGVLGMALGEYIVHAWDLARATGRPYDAPDAAVGPAHEFLLGMVAPEYRGPDTGFFDAEVEVPTDASPLDRLLGFAGRDPKWTSEGFPRPE